MGYEFSSLGHMLVLMVNALLLYSMYVHMPLTGHYNTAQMVEQLPYNTHIVP